MEPDHDAGKEPDPDHIGRGLVLKKESSLWQENVAILQGETEII